MLPGAAGLEVCAKEETKEGTKEGTEEENMVKWGLP